MTTRTSGRLLAALVPLNTTILYYHYASIQPWFRSTEVLLDPGRGCKNGIPGPKESLLEVQRKQLIGAWFVRDLQQQRGLISLELRRG